MYQYREQRELIVVRVDKTNPDEISYHPCYLDIFDTRSAFRFVEREKNIRGPWDQDKTDYILKRISLPMRFIWVVKSNVPDDDEPIVGVWCKDEKEAKHLAVVENSEALENLDYYDDDPEDRYSAKMVEMSDDDILDTFFDGDEDEFQKKLGCIPQTYDRLADPMGNIPFPQTLPLFPKGE